LGLGLENPPERDAGGGVRGRLADRTHVRPPAHLSANYCFTQALGVGARREHRLPLANHRRRGSGAWGATYLPQRSPKGAALHHRAVPRRGVSSSRCLRLQLLRAPRAPSSQRAAPAFGRPRSESGSSDRRGWQSQEDSAGRPTGGRGHLGGYAAPQHLLRHACSVRTRPVHGVRASMPNVRVRQPRAQHSETKGCKFVLLLRTAHATRPRWFKAAVCTPAWFRLAWTTTTLLPCTLMAARACLRNCDVVPRRDLRHMGFDLPGECTLSRSGRTRGEWKVPTLYVWPKPNQAVVMVSTLVWLE